MEVHEDEAIAGWICAPKQTRQPRAVASANAGRKDGLVRVGNDQKDGLVRVGNDQKDPLVRVGNDRKDPLVRAGAGRKVGLVRVGTGRKDPLVRVGTGRAETDRDPSHAAQQQHRSAAAGPQRSAAQRSAARRSSAAVESQRQRRRRCIGKQRGACRGCGTPAAPWWDQRSRCSTDLGPVGPLQYRGGTSGTAAVPMWDQWDRCSTNMGPVGPLQYRCGTSGTAAVPRWDQLSRSGGRRMPAGIPEAACSSLPVLPSPAGQMRGAAWQVMLTPRIPLARGPNAGGGRGSLPAFPSRASKGPAEAHSPKFSSVGSQNAGWLACNVGGNRLKAVLHQMHFVSQLGKQLAHDRLIPARQIISIAKSPVKV